MRIRNQTWIETDKYLVITLHQPWWSAWKTFNWPVQQEGLGVSREAIDIALKLGKKLRINVINYGSYEISPKRALSIASSYTFTPRDGKQLIVIPRLECYQIPKGTYVKQQKERQRRGTVVRYQTQTLFPKYKTQRQ